jgi:hypothetical protein
MIDTNSLFPMLLARKSGGGGGGTGTVTEIATGAGLTTDDGQAITSSGTIKANLADDTALSGANLYNIGVDSTGYLAVVVPWTDTTYTFDGTYNASTNPAATVSTVTNAINALDVAGASSIPASKTISAWSETDGKVSVSTQDIAITGSQAVLTGYTKASTATAIVSTDTLNQAVGKLEKALDSKQDTIGNRLASLGFAYADCTTYTDSGRIYRNAYTINNYNYVDGSIIVARFHPNGITSVPANAQLEINYKGERKIYFKNERIQANVITDQDYCLLQYQKDFGFYLMAKTSTIEDVISLLSRMSTVENDISLLQDEVDGRTFTFTSGGSIPTNVNVGDVVDVNNPSSVASWSYTVSPIQAGEIVTITGAGGSTPRLWAFTDKDYKLISNAPDSTSMSGTTVTAPANSAYIIVNSVTTSLGFCGIKGVKDDISSLQGKVKAHSEGGTNYDVINGIRVYVSSTAPTGDIPTGSLWIGG